MVEFTFNMASNNGEHTPKRFRQMSEEKEPAGTRYIKLDMKKYDSSVQAYSDEDLVKVSATLKIAIFPYLRFQRFQIDILESFL